MGDFCRAGRFFSRCVPGLGFVGRVFARDAADVTGMKAMAPLLAKTRWIEVYFACGGVSGFTLELMGASGGVSGFSGGPSARCCRRGDRSQSPDGTPFPATRRQPQPRPRPLPLAGEGEVHQEQVEGDDDGRDEETCDTQGAIVDVVAHDLTVCGQAHEWDDREGDAE